MPRLKAPIGRIVGIIGIATLFIVGILTIALHVGLVAPDIPAIGFAVVAMLLLGLALIVVMLATRAGAAPDIPSWAHYIANVVPHGPRHAWRQMILFFMHLLRPIGGDDRSRTWRRQLALSS